MMAGQRWLYSSIQYRRDRATKAIVVGAVLFSPDRDVPLLVQFRENPLSKLKDGARGMMAARAFVNRLKLAGPHSAEEIRAFASLEGNAVQLTEPQEITPTASPEAMLRLVSAPAEPSPAWRVAYVTAGRLVLHANVANTLQPSVFCATCAVVTGARGLLPELRPQRSPSALAMRREAEHVDARPS
ncbi:MAG: hypothetical protein ACLQVI_09640 [Polyangiaceae bacterium]